MRKSIFAKIFSINMIIIFTSIFVLGVVQYAMLSRYMYRESIGSLQEDAKYITEYIKSGSEEKRLENFISMFTKSTNTHVLIVDRTGRILLKGSNNSLFNENITHIDEKYTAEVFSNRDHIIRGTLGDVYRTPMFTLQVPIIADRPNNVLGAIFISTTVPEMTRMRMQMFKILVMSFLVVLILSFILSFVLSRHISKPIKKISNVAKSFASGNLSSRVEIDRNGKKIIEIDELTHTFNDMAMHLEQSDNVRNNFISDVSHELRTPMTTIGGFIDGILDDTIPKERQRDYLIIIKEEIQRLSSLTNSFLDIARQQAGSKNLEMSVFDINELIRRALVGFEKKITEKDISVTVDFCEDSCMVQGDINAIRQVLTNLIENAIKFTNTDGLLKISVSSKGGEAEISIYNTGCGIPQAEQSLIFERFYKADKSRSINRNGTGIGLYIAKDIINRHGKEIKVSSVEGEYAEFCFSLDKAKS